MLTVQLTGHKTWRKCAAHGNIFHEVGVYTLNGTAYLAYFCERCRTLTLSDTLVEQPSGG